MFTRYVSPIVGFIDDVREAFFINDINKVAVSLFMPAILGSHIVDYDILHHILLTVYRGKKAYELDNIYDNLYQFILKTVFRSTVKDYVSLNDNCIVDSSEKYYAFNLHKKEYLNNSILEKNNYIGMGNAEADYGAYLVDIKDLVAEYPQIKLLSPLGLVIGDTLYFKSTS